MKSPTTALIWELWRKNRWGFDFLVVLLALCAAVSWHAIRLRQEAGRPQQQAEPANAPTASGQLWGQQMLRASNGAAAGRVVRLTLTWPAATEAPRMSDQARREFYKRYHIPVPRRTPVAPRNAARQVSAPVVYQGPLSAQDVLSWSVSPGQSYRFFGGAYRLRVSLNGKVIFEGSIPSLGTALHCSILNGAHRFTPAGMRLIPSQQQSAALALAEDELAAASAGKAALAWAEADVWRSAGLEWGTVLFGFSILVAFAIFGCSEAHPRIGFTGIPPREFTLPVRTETLVLWPSLVGSATVIVLSLAWWRLVFGPLLASADSVLSGLYLAALLASGLALFQMLVWGLPSFPKTRVFLVTVLVLGLVALAAIPPWMQRARSSSWPGTWVELEPMLLAAFAVAWVTGLAGGWLGVRLERRGAWAGWQRSARLANFLRAWAPRALDFGSPLHAQFWFEWRRNCRVPLLVWTLVVWFVLGATWMKGGLRGQFLFSDVSDALGLLTTLGLLGSMAVIGLILARDPSSRRLTLSSFTATRPVRTGDLLAAKLLAGILTWFLAVAILAVSATVAITSTGKRVGVPDTLTLLILAVLSLNVFVGILPLSLSGRIPGLPWSLLPLLLLYGGLGEVVNWAARHQLMAPLATLLMLAVVLKLWLASIGFRRAIGLRLVSFGFVGAYAAFWLMSTLFLLVIVAPVGIGRSLASSPGSLQPLRFTIILSTAVLAIPLARIAFSPLALARNRHR
jgi:hypothetical protein